MTKQYILGIDTATKQCSVAFSANGEIITSKAETGRAVHNQKLTDFVEATMQNAGFDFAQLDGIAVNIGPGSFTGLRIGLSTAKGLAFPHNIPILPIPAFSILEAMTSSVTKPRLLFIRSHKNYLYYTLPASDPDSILAPDVKYSTLPQILAENSSVQSFRGNHDFAELRETGELEIILPSAEMACKLGYQYFDELQKRDHSELEPQYISNFEAKKWKPGIKAKNNLKK